MKTHPFYIDAPDFDDNSSLAVQLHVLCDMLNQMGYEAYVHASCNKLNGRLWTPRLTPQVQGAHYKAGKVPITVTTRSKLTRLSTVDIGILAVYQPEGRMIDGRELLAGQVYFISPYDDEAQKQIELLLPIADPSIFLPSHGVNDGARSNIRLVYAENFQSNGGKLRHEHLDAHDISPSKMGTLSAQERAQWLQKAQCLYVYEVGAIVTEARLCGCPVVYVPNDIMLATSAQGIWNTEGTCSNTLPPLGSDEYRELQSALLIFRERYLNLYKHSAESIENFSCLAHDMADQLAIDLTQQDKGWSSEVLDTLQDWFIDKKDRAQYADASKYRRLQAQYITWRKRSSIREIDAQVYAEHVVSGDIDAPAVLIYAHSEDMELIARTIDSLGQSLRQPARLLVIAPFACPIPTDELGEQASWIHRGKDHQLSHNLADVRMPNWCLLLEAGTTLEPHALIEFALTMRQPTSVQLAYCDDDTEAPGGAIPHFKPDLNIEWLRCFNYLGGAVAVQTALWRACKENDQFGSVYKLALQLSATQGSAAFAHIDTVLAHLIGQASQQRANDQESREMLAVKQTLSDNGLTVQMQPGRSWGNWQIEYLPKSHQTVSLVVPTGLQLGYLKCLLESLKSYGDAALAEILLVTSPDQQADVQLVISEVNVGLPARIVVVESSALDYNYSAALNAGAREAYSDLILFMDDDTECLQTHWLETLRGYFDQADIGCVAPRLVLQIQKEATLQCGPLVPNAEGLLRSYSGERALLDEQGTFARLQTSQDVPAVAGHCFITKRSTWQALGGFDEHTFNLYHSVADFCLRARQRGWRHVWTPVSSVIHHGGKTLNFVQRETEIALSLRERAVREHELWQERWVAYLGRDGSYSRHLSLHKAYEVETDIVLDWPRTRRDRPAFLALPIASGSGQYRVVEPLNALQSAGLAYTCVVLPRADRSLRSVSALEIARAHPDTLIVQHSIGDQHFKQLRSYRRSCPSIFIVQMVDDLFRDLPPKHPHHNLHRREGDLRMKEAISLCDRLIVSTRPLADAYSPYCSDVQVMPNCIDDSIWNMLPQKTQPRKRLRVGWAGAMQHLDDLEMIVDVVKELSDEVDWVFMGMCPDILRPYVKEFHKFVSYSEYPKKLASLDLDIAIAPLCDNTFNESKSNLRLLEYGSMGWPVVCSDVYPFRTKNPPVCRVQNNAPAWIEALNNLITDSTIRLKKGEELNHWVRENYTLSLHVNNWKLAFNKF